MLEEIISLEEYPNIIITKPPEHIDADLSIIVFKEAKSRNKKPEDLAKEILDLITKKYNFIKEANITGGYINIKLDWSKLLKEWKRLLEFKEKNRKILIEYVSVNPNKALHIGHFRNAILGDALKRLFKLLGYKIEALNYIDDTGSQIADVLVGIYYLGFPEDPIKFDENTLKEIVNHARGNGINIEMNKLKDIVEDRKRVLKMLYGYDIPSKFDHYCGDFIYVVVNRLYKEYPELETLRYKVIKDIEDRKDPIFSLMTKVVDKVLKAQLETLWKFDIYFDLLNFESDIIHFGLWDKTFKLLKDKGIIEYITKGDKKDCWIIDLSKYEEFKGLSDPKKVLVRSNGTTVYLAKDIAYAFWKLGLVDRDFKYSKYLDQPNNEELWRTDINGIENPKGFGHADVSINVIGAEQKLLQQIISKIVSEVSNNKKEYIHYAYGLVMLSSDTAKLFGIQSDKKIVRMSGRKGIYLNVDNLLNKAIEICRKKIIERDPEISGESLNELAFKMARSMLSYEMLKHSPNKEIIFDLERALELQGNTSVYLQYTYARINSIIRKAKISSTNPDDWLKINSNLTGEEIKLIRKLFEFKDIIKEVERSLSINKLADYAIDLASTFNEFYQKVPVIKELEEKPHRMAIVLITKKILEKIFYVLKIDAVERI